MSTPIIIRRWRDTRKLIVFFPTEPASKFTPHRCAALDAGQPKCVDYRDCVEKHKSGQLVPTERPPLEEQLAMLATLNREGYKVTLYQRETRPMRIARTERWQELYGKKASV